MALNKAISAVLALCVMLVNVKAESPSAELVTLLQRYLEQAEPKCDSYKQGDVEYKPTLCSSQSECSSDKVCCPVHTFPFSLCILKSELTSSTDAPPPPNNDKMQDDEVPVGICDSLRKNDFETRDLLERLLKRTNLVSFNKCDQPLTRSSCSIEEICCNLAPAGKICRPIKDTKAGDKIWCKDNTELCARP